MIHEVSISEEMIHDLTKTIMEKKLKRELTKDEDERLWTEVLSRKNRKFKQKLEKSLNETK